MDNIIYRIQFHLGDEADDRDIPDPTSHMRLAVGLPVSPLSLLHLTIEKCIHAQVPYQSCARSKFLAFMTVKVLAKFVTPMRESMLRLCSL